MYGNLIHMYKYMYMYLYDSIATSTAYMHMFLVSQCFCKLHFALGGLYQPGKGRGMPRNATHNVCVHWQYT